MMGLPADDGLVFDVDNLSATAIREEMEYGGTRLKTVAYLEKTRIPITIDIGFGDAMADPTRQLDYPSLLDLPAPNIRTYPPATVIAEKFQAIMVLGIANGRMKDFYDLWAIPRSINVPDEELDAALAATFARRPTAIPIERPAGLTPEMVDDTNKQRQWNAYAASIELENVELQEVVDAIWALIGPTCARLARSS